MGMIAVVAIPVLVLLVIVYMQFRVQRGSYKKADGRG